MINLKEIAHAHGCSIFVIVHSRKSTAKNALDFADGLDEAADATWILTPNRGLAGNSLFISARDREEQTIDIAFDRKDWRWSPIKDAPERAMGRERREVFDLLLPGVEMRTGDIVKALGKKPPAVSHLLKMLEMEGIIHTPRQGWWIRTAP
jgi:DNA-binding transcriptional ArsR family regulator